MMKIFLSSILALSLLSCSSVTQVQRDKNSKRVPMQDEALQKNDPILDEVSKKEKTKEKESPLLEKIILQMLEKKKRKEDASTVKNMSKKTDSEDNNILTPDPLLDEI